MDLFPRNTVVADLVVTNIDPDGDTVSGTTDTPGAQVEVGHMYCDDDGCHAIRRILADDDGEWIANFSLPGSDGDERDNETFNIVPGTGSEVRQPDEDGDTTAVQWRLPNPYFDVRANWDQVGAWEWPLGATLTLEIDDPGTPEEPDESFTQVVSLHPDDPSQTYAEFNVGESIDIQAGFEVSLSDGTTTKTLTVSPLSFTSVDIDNDMVYGVADPEVQVGVWACDESGCYNYHTTSDSLGAWMVDMTQLSDQGVAFDIVGGTWIDSEQRNEAGDSTMFGMNIPNPFLIAFPEYDAVEGWEWPDGSTVYLTIDDPATTDSITRLWSDRWGHGCDHVGRSTHLYSL